MSTKGPLDFKQPSVIGVEDSDIDPDGYIPLELLLKGIDVIVPLWPSHATEPEERDLLIVFFKQPGQPLVKIENIYKAEDIKPLFIIPIDAIHLQVNGVGELWYELFDSADNPSKSGRRNLTIDHTPVPVDLEESDFPHKNPDGYLNCSTEPPLWEGVTVFIPALLGFKVGDRVEVIWRGYSSLNGSSVEHVRARKKVVREELSDEDIKYGYSVVIEPYDVHIKPMVENSSATVRYRVFRGRRLVGLSKLGLVKIDRVRPGYPPCEPTKSQV